MEKAKPHTAPEALEKCVANEFLASCLAKAGFDTELCGDVTDACEVAELNALDLASGDLSSEEVANRLFLVDTEARKLVKVCARLCAREGVDFGAGVGDGESSEEEPPPPPPAPAPAPAEEKQGEEGAVDASMERSPSAHSRSLSSYGEGGAPAPSAEEARAAQEKQEEEERRQQQIKEEQRAAALAAFAPKPIPTSAATAALAPQAMQGDGFPPGFSPPPPLGQPRKTPPASKERKDIPHARKLSAYDGNSFGIRGDSTFTPPPGSARAQSARGPAPSPRTPATTTMTIHTPNTSRTSSIAANRYERPPSKDSKPTLSADAMKPANMTTPSKPTLSNEDMKPANMTTPVSKPSPKSSTEDMKPANMVTPPSAAPTPDGKAEPEKKAQKAPPSSARVPSYLRPTAAFQNQVKRTKEPETNMMGKLAGSATTRTPIRPTSCSTRLPPQYVHKAYHDGASSYGAKTHRARHHAGDDSSETSNSSSKIPAAPQTSRPTMTPSPHSIRPPSSNLLKPTEAFLAATSGNSERKKQSNVSGGSTVLVSHTQSTVLSPSDITPQSKPFRARPMPKFMQPGSATGTAHKAVPRTPRHTGPPAAPSQTPRGTAGKVLKNAQESQRRIELELVRLRQLQERLYELGEVGDDIDELCRVRTPSGRHSYITSSMLQPHPHIPMRELEKSAAKQAQQQSPAAQSRLPRGPAADDVLRQSACTGTLLPNGYGQLTPAQKQRKQQLMEQHQQQAALIRSLSEEHSRSHPGHVHLSAEDLSHEAHVRSLEEGDTMQCGDVENDEGHAAANAHQGTRNSHTYDNGNEHAPENGDAPADRGTSGSQAGTAEEGSVRTEQGHAAGNGQQPQQEEQQQQQQRQQQEQEQQPQEQRKQGECAKNMQGSHLSESGNHFYEGHVDENFTQEGVVQVELA